MVGIVAPRPASRPVHTDRANQLGRRNLTPDAFKLLLGRRYNRAKKTKAEAGAKGGASKVQIDPCLPSTAAKFAVQHAVSENTVKRAGKFAEQVERTPALARAVAERRLGELLRATPKAKPPNPKPPKDRRCKNGTDDHQPTLSKLHIGETATPWRASWLLKASLVAKWQRSGKARTHPSEVAQKWRRRFILTLSSQGGNLTKPLNLLAVLLVHPEGLEPTTF